MSRIGLLFGSQKPFKLSRINVLHIAQILSEEKINFILQKARFLDRFKNQFNLRQEKVILRMLDSENFEGGINASKYISITKTSKATATRDLIEVFQLGALKQIKAGRSSRYEINWD